MLSILLSFITICWMFFAFFVDSNYINMLTAAIRKRTLDARDISITDSGSLNFLLTKLQSGTEEEAISVLHLVSSQPVDREKFYREGLHHRATAVKRFALELIQSQHTVSLLPELRTMLVQQSFSESLPQLVRTVGLLDDGQDISGYLHHENIEVANAAAVVLLSHSDPARKAIGENHLQTLFTSDRAEFQVNALNMTGELRIRHFTGHVQELLLPREGKIYYHALIAAGKLSDEKLIRYLLSIYEATPRDHDILEALRLSGETAVHEIKHFLTTAPCSSEKRRRLLLLLGKIGGHEALSFLQEALPLFPLDSNTILSVMYQLRFACDGNESLYKKLLAETLETATGHLYRLNSLQKQRQKYELILNALDLEVSALREKSIWLFSFLYDSSKIKTRKGRL